MLRTESRDFVCLFISLWVFFPSGLFHGTMLDLWEMCGQELKATLPLIRSSPWPRPSPSGRTHDPESWEYNPTDSGLENLVTQPLELQQPWGQLILHCRSVFFLFGVRGAGFFWSQETFATRILPLSLYLFLCLSLHIYMCVCFLLSITKSQKVNLRQEK